MRRLEPSPPTGTLQPAAVRHKHRWAVLFAVPIVLLSLLWMGMGVQQLPVAQAQAETIAYVGCNDASMAPNFGSLPEAIQTLGPDSQLNICPGTYYTGVNLSHMAEVGNITVQRAPGTTGDVNIFTTSEPAIYISKTLPFTGNVTIRDINVSSQSDAAIALGEDVFCCLLDFARVLGAVHIFNVHASDTYGEGILVNATDEIYIESSTAISNDDEGFELNILPRDILIAGQVGAAAVVTPTITLSNVVANYNYEDNGILIGSYLGEGLLSVEGDEPLQAAEVPSYEFYDLVIVNTIANSNGEGGIYINGLGNITIQDTEASFNGTEFPGSDPRSSGIVINIMIVGAGDISCPASGTTVFERVNVSDNRGWGIAALSLENDFLITETTAIGNDLDGIFVFAPALSLCGGNISLVNSQAEENGFADLLALGVSDGEAAAQAAETGDMRIAENGDPQFGGFRLIGNTIQVTDQNEANRNNHFGFCLDAWPGPLEVEDASAIENSGDGVVYSPTCYPDLLSIGAAAEERTVGVAASPYPLAYITNTTASANAGTGISLTVTLNDIFVENVTAASNNIGIAVNREEILPLGASVAIDSVVPIEPQVFIQDSLIQSNEFYGVLVDQLYPDFSPIQQFDSINAAAAITPTEVISQSIICQNGIGLGTRVSTYAVGIGGIEAQDALDGVLVDARGNWWGHKSGPTVATNPEGLGDSIVTLSGDVDVLPLELVEGTVLYDPWIDTFISLAQPNPTVVGVPVDLLFQYADAGSTYYLADGVGDPNNPPIFTLSTDNGAIDGSNNVGKRIVDKQVTGTLLPAAAGVANVTLAGPCGLTQQVAVPVAAPSINIEKSPDLQAIPPNGTAVFTVTIQNTGDITLTEIAVSDAVAPNCARVAGALDDLGPGASTSYTCELTVANNLVNSAEVTARPLVGGEPSDPVVSDSDTAEVRIANIEVVKTVGVVGDSPDCPAASDIQAPISTTVQYCFTVTNIGSYTLTTHSLFDDHLGTIFTDLTRELAPGESFSTVDVGLTLTDTLYTTTTNIATWTASAGEPVVNNPVSAADFGAAQVVVEVTTQTSAVVRITADPPTAVDPDDQPGESTEFLFLPSLRQP